MNVAISKAEHAGRDGILRAGSFDYPVVLNLLGGYRFSNRWQASVGRPI